MHADTLNSALRLPLEPYPGLRPFLDHEAMLLLGRGRQVLEVIARLRETRFVAVIGGSGSGKSSLIRAGVVPELRGFGIPDAGDYWVPIVCTPGTTKIVAKQAHAPEAVVAGGRGWLDTLQTPITRLAWKFSKELDPAHAVLARRVAANEIEPPAQPFDADAEATLRREDIAAMFRQGAGFARLAKAYSEELPAVGPQREKARFLFVIDQFEELFHPNNRDNSDAQALVEAVIDHFFNPHPRCFVVLTMRSEHLADCARYLQLPDAINKSSYLVRRLDDDEIREAIVGPAKYFLRLQRRGDPGTASSLPDDVVFDDDVIERLLADVGKITDDPDHLPLLQHALARTWESACRRCTPEGEAQRVAGHIQWLDLEHAVDPCSLATGGWLKGATATNTLRQSLENWATAIYHQRTPGQQAQLDTVLRHLAFKDPNNGQYSQQRVDVDDPRLFEGVNQPRSMLHALLEHGFLDSVNYLFWDKENPEQVTLKVSHESFIRGWEHFRTLVDADAEHFEEFVSVLRRCARWKFDEKPEFLLEASELLRFEAAELKPVFAVQDNRDEWFRVLLQYRDGERLSKMEPFVDAFLEASRARVAAEAKRRDDAEKRERAAVEGQRETERQRLAEQIKFEAEVHAARAEAARADAERQAARADMARAEAEKQAARADADRVRAEIARAEAVTLAARAETARAQMDEARTLAEMDRAAAQGQRNKLLLAALLFSLVIVLPLTAFAWFVQRPVLNSVDKFTSARTLAEQIPSPAQLAASGSAVRALDGLLVAANLVDQAKSEAGFVVDKAWMQTLAGWFGPAAEMQQLFAKTSSEPLVNGSMRSLMTTQVWRSDTDPTRVLASAMFKPARSERDCSVVMPSGEKVARAGSLFYDATAMRGAFFPVPERGETEIALYAATLAGDKCEAGRIVWSVPLRLKPLLLLDAQVRYIAVAQTEATLGPPVVSFYKIFWKSGEEGLRFLSVVADPEAVKLVSAEFEPRAAASRAAESPKVDQVRGVRSWRERAGIGVLVAGQTWRLFADGAQHVDATTAADWKEIGLPTPGSGCERLGAALLKHPPLAGFTPKTLQQSNLCFAIQRGNTPQPARPNAPGISASAPAAEQVVVSVYMEPTAQQAQTLEAGLPASIASLTAFDHAAPGPNTWVTATGENFRGWIALRRESGGSIEYLGVPWSTDALSRLAKQVQVLSTVPLSTPIRAPAIAPSRTPPASSPPPR